MSDLLSKKIRLIREFWSWWIICFEYWNDRILIVLKFKIIRFTRKIIFKKKRPVQSLSCVLYSQSFINIRVKLSLLIKLVVGGIIIKCMNFMLAVALSPSSSRSFLFRIFSIKFILFPPCHAESLSDVKRRFSNEQGN